LLSQRFGILVSTCSIEFGSSVCDTSVPTDGQAGPAGCRRSCPPSHRRNYRQGAEKLANPSRPGPHTKFPPASRKTATHQWSQSADIRFGGGRNRRRPLTPGQGPVPRRGGHTATGNGAHSARSPAERASLMVGFASRRPCGCWAPPAESVTEMAVPLTGLRLPLEAGSEH
jgi:hypothetical protein